MIIQFIEERGLDILTWISVSAATRTGILRTEHPDVGPMFHGPVFLRFSPSAKKRKKSVRRCLVRRLKKSFLQLKRTRAASKRLANPVPVRTYRILFHGLLFSSPSLFLLIFSIRSINACNLS